jgi:site-specific recombinase XerD
MTSPTKSITEKLADTLGDDAGTVETFLQEFHGWLREYGQNPQRNRAMADSGAANYHARIDQLYRFVLEVDELQTERRLTTEQADDLIRRLDEDEILTQSETAYSQTSKRKFANALQKYFEWLHYEDITSEPWEPNVVFVDGEHESADSLSFEERHQIRETALEYSSLPAYYETSPEERERINSVVAQRLGKPQERVTKRNWEEADTSAKVGSLVAVTLETGMIPIEIKHARVDWYNPRKQVFVIPTEYAAKNRPTTELPLTDDTAEILSEWMRERRHLSAYDDTTRLWLNQSQNPYTSGNLCYLVRQLCKDAGIHIEDRKIVWYSLRHNLGHTFEEVADISATKDQLRHQYLETTKNIYGETATEKRRYTLEAISETAEEAATNDTYNPYKPDVDRTITVNSDGEQQVDDAHTVHIDQEIADTTNARSQLARDILDPDDE